MSSTTQELYILGINMKEDFFESININYNDIVAILAVNVDNTEISDTEFRRLVLELINGIQPSTGTDHMLTDMANYLNICIPL